MAEESHHVGNRILIAGCGRSPGALPSSITPIEADLQEPEQLAARLPQAVDTVYYIVTPSSLDDAGYRQAFVAGLANLTAALGQQAYPPRRLVFVSSTAVYGQADGDWIDEDSPTEPPRFSGQRLLQAESIALSGPWEGVVARFGGIYSAERDALVRKARSAEPCQEATYTNRIHAEDVVAILAHLGHPAVPSGIYLGVDDRPATQCEVLDLIAEELGLPPPPRADDSAAGSARGVGSKRGSNHKLKASGYRFRYPTFREGYRAILGAAGSSPSR